MGVQFAFDANNNINKMKTAALILLALVAGASAQGTGAWCRCAAFITFENTEFMVYESAEVPIDDCQDDAKQCKNACTAQINELSDNGNLWYLQESGETVGQTICSDLASPFVPFVHNHYVYGYFEVCGGAWEYTGIASTQQLCCNGGKHEHCISL